MPKISAPTLVEHRERQRALLLGAARDIALDSGVRGLTLSAVATRAGLARSSLYEYFPSTDALVATLATEEMTRWADEVAEAVDRAEGPREEVLVYVRTTLRFVSDGGHRLARAFAEVTLPPDCLRDIERAHRRLADPLQDALRALGVDDPARAAELLQGAVISAAARVEAGRPERAEAAAVERFVLGGLRALGARLS